MEANMINKGCRQGKGIIAGQYIGYSNLRVNIFKTTTLVVLGLR